MSRFLNTRGIVTVVGLICAFQTFDAAAQGLTKITIGYTAVANSYLPLKIAEEAKLFEKHGLEAEVVFVRGGSTLMKSVLSGEVTAGCLGGTPTILARAAGADVKMVFSFSNTLPYQILAGPHLLGKISRIEDLKGKRVAISARGAESESVVRLLLQKHGLTAQDVVFLQVGEAGERLAAIKAGSADVAAIPSPQHLRATRAGFPVLSDMIKEQLEWFHTGVAMRESWVRREPKLAEAVVKAFVEAVHYGWANKAFTKSVLAKYIKTDDDEQLEQGYQDFLTYQPKNFQPSLTGIRASLDELAETNPKVKSLKPEELIDLAILGQLERAGFMAEMKARYRR